jgi:hypothetical protein
MAIPSPVVNQQGIGAVTADNLNTFIQGVLSLAQLRTFTGESNMNIFLMGYSAVNDGGQGLYYWSPTAIGPDNGTTIIMPSVSTKGAWLRYGALA